MESQVSTFCLTWLLLPLPWLVVLNGVITLILGILVLNSWPSSSFWLIGLYVGISLLFSGISLLAAGLATRKALSGTEV